MEKLKSILTLFIILVINFNTVYANEKKGIDNSSGKWVIEKLNTVADNNKIEIKYFYDENGNNYKKVIISESAGTNSIATTLNSYDGNSFLIKSVLDISTSTGHKSKTITEFLNNSEGKAIKQIEKTIGPGGNSSSTSSNDYDSEGRIIKTVRLVTFPNNPINKQIELREYDSCGNITKMVYQGQGYSNVMKTEYTYKDNCLNLSETRYTNDVINSETSNEHNTDGKVIKATTIAYGPSKTKQMTSVTKYAYDINGNLNTYEYSAVFHGNNQKTNSVSKYIWKKLD